MTPFYYALTTDIIFLVSAQIATHKSLRIVLCAREIIKQTECVRVPTTHLMAPNGSVIFWLCRYAFGFWRSRPHNDRPVPVVRPLCVSCGFVHILVPAHRITIYHRLEPIISSLLGSLLRSYVAHHARPSSQQQSVSSMYDMSHAHGITCSLDMVTSAADWSYVWHVWWRVRLRGIIPCAFVLKQFILRSDCTMESGKRIKNGQQKRDEFHVIT